MSFSETPTATAAIPARMPTSVARAACSILAISASDLTTRRCSTMPVQLTNVAPGNAAFTASCSNARKK
jgi:hypothetical protein